MERINKDQIIDKLSNLFKLKNIKEIKQLPSARNIVYSIVFQNKHYIFKLTDHKYEKDSKLEYETIKKIYLQNGSVPTPIDYKQDIKISNNLYNIQIYKYINGNKLNINTEDFYRFGLSIANLHNITANFDNLQEYPKSTLEDLITLPIKEINKFDTENRYFNYLNNFSNTIKPLLKKYNNPDYIGITHGDTHHYNALLNSNNQIIIFDFEDLSLQWRAFDIATAIWGTFGHGGDPEIWHSLLTGYKSTRSIDQEEERLIRYLIAIRHIWWLGFRAKNWNNWENKHDSNLFFQNGLEFFENIVDEVCGINISHKK